MEFANVIAARYRVRVYRPEPFEDEKLRCVLEAARLIDAAIVPDHLILAVTNLGLDRCWSAAFNVDGARSVLELSAM